MRGCRVKAASVSQTLSPIANSTFVALEGFVIARRPQIANRNRGGRRSVSIGQSDSDRFADVGGSCRQRTTKMLRL